MYGHFHKRGQKFLFTKSETDEKVFSDSHVHDL